MTVQPPLLLVLLQERRMNRYGIFRAEYDKAARKLDPYLVGSAPSRAQLHRWVSGGLKRLPYTDHCRVLEAMFPGWTADQLFAPCPPGVPAHDRNMFMAVSNHRSAAQIPATNPRLESFADVFAVFPTRGEFTSAMPPHILFDGAKDIRTAGLSLNLVCQQYPDQRLHQLIQNGTRMRCLFLNPDGEAIKAREHEEGYADHHLTMLTKLNIEVLTRLRKRLPPEARDRLSIAVYDETIRFNITLIDSETCVIQPYLPQARGVDSPTFLVHRGITGNGLYDTFEQVFTALSERSTLV